MLNIDYHTDQLYNNMVLSRFSIHKEELKRHLQATLQEVYRLAYDRGVADRSNQLHDENEVEVKKTVETENTLKEDD